MYHTFQANYIIVHYTFTIITSAGAFELFARDIRVLSLVQINTENGNDFIYAITRKSRISAFYIKKASNSTTASKGIEIKGAYMHTNRNLIYMLSLERTYQRKQISACNLEIFIHNFHLRILKK